MLRILKYLENWAIEYQNNKIVDFLSNKNINTIVDVGGHHGEFYNSALKHKINKSLNLKVIEKINFKS